jgi:hypothetical protein
MTSAADNIVPFGKYKGQPVEAMLADPSYCAWVLAQPGIRERYAGFITIVVNGGSAPDAPTPEHNRLQALFLDGEMLLATYRSIVGDQAIKKRLRDAIWRSEAVAAREEAEETERTRIRSGAVYLALKAEEQRAHKEWRDARVPWSSPLGKACDVAQEAVRKANYGIAEAAKAAGEKAARATLDGVMASGEPLREFYADIIARGARYEYAAWDVVINHGCIYVELKPQMGDDFPTVLRTVLGRTARLEWQDYSVNARVVIVDRFDAEGVTYDQVKQMFAASGVVVRTLAEIRALMPASAP